MTSKPTLICSALVALYLAGPQPLEAQGRWPDAGKEAADAGEDEHGELARLVAASTRLAPADDEARIELDLRRGFDCGRDSIRPTTTADALGCDFTNTTAGFSYSDSWSNDLASLGARVEVSRGTAGAFALDHQMRGFAKDFNSETLVSNLGLQGSLFEDRVEFDAKTSWSRSWDVPVVMAPLDPHRLNETSGTATQLRVKTRIVDQPGLKWSIEGKVSQMDADYRSYRAPVHNRLLVAQGNSASLSTLLDVAGWRLKASSSNLETRYLDSETIKFSAGRSGMTVSASRRTSAVRADSIGASLASQRSVRSQVAIDFDMHTLMPLVAIDDTGWKSLLPKLLTLEATRTDKYGFGALGGTESTQASFGGQGYWSTPLGDTLVNLRFEKLTGVRPGNVTQSGSDLFVFVNHSFKLDDWSIDLDYFTSRNASVRGLSAVDDTILDSYGVTARYAHKDMPRLELRLGRDNLGFDTGGGDLRLRDQSLRAEAKVDFTPWIRKRLQRDDVNLALHAQYDFDESSYQLLLLDQLIDSNLEQFMTQGILLNFSMSLP